MSGDYLLDSNIIIGVFRGNKKAVARVEKIVVMHIPVIVIGELFYGAYKSDRTEERISKIKQLEANFIVLDITKTTSQIYGEIKDQLRAKGRPIPENDIWIGHRA
ncbi:MAG: PIN domain-containing protein [Saprospiraceae bacterium]